MDELEYYHVDYLLTRGRAMVKGDCGKLYPGDKIGLIVNDREYVGEIETRISGGAIVRIVIC